MDERQKLVHSESSPPELGQDLFAREPELRAAVSQHLGVTRFSLWFGDGVRMGLSDNGHTLEVRVPNAFFHEWIRDHYSASLLEAASAVTGRPLKLSIQIQHEAELPNANPLGLQNMDIRPVPSPQRCEKQVVSSPALEGIKPSVTLNLAESTLPVSQQTRVSSFSQVSIPSRNQHVTVVRATSQPTRRLENFVIGSSNQLAYAAAKAMVESRGTLFNPLVIHAAVGLGKTHLLEGITHALKQAQPSLNVVQLTAEAFTNQFLESMRAGALSSFRARYRSVGGLIVDDIHFLAAKRATQDEFLHTFNVLIAKGALIVLATDQHPRRISHLSDELVTRFLGGMVAKIEVPDRALRRAILQRFAAARGIEIPDTILTYIAEHLRSSIRELEGALCTVIAHTELIDRHISLDCAKHALRDSIRHTARAIGLRDVEQVVCRLFQVDATLLKSESRARVLAYPRMLAMYLARKYVGAPYNEIGHFFGGRNHSTVISAERKVKEWLRAEERNRLLPGFETVADLLADLEQSLGSTDLA
jgi:chromosomal replication initiator protein